MKTAWLFPALVAGTISNSASAGDEISQHEIRRLVEQGEIMPLQQLLQQYSPERYGKLLDLEAEYEHGMVVYEMEFLNANGQVIELEIDAHSGALLKREIED